MLNDRAREILAFIRRFQSERGFPPTIREIGRASGISSTNGVRYYLTMLEKAGHLKRQSKVSRGTGLTSRPHAGGIPILGRIAAGQPNLAEQSFDGALEMNEVFGDPDGLFALRVRGDSMVEAGVFQGDYVVVRQREQATNGDMVVALVGDEATVKYYRPHADHIELIPANANYAPIRVEPGTDFRILGVVTGVLRTVGR